MSDYKIGGVAGLISSKKKKSKGDQLESLFTVKNTPVQKPVVKDESKQPLEVVQKVNKNKENKKKLKRRAENSNEIVSAPKKPKNVIDSDDDDPVYKGHSSKNAAKRIADKEKMKQKVDKFTVFVGNIPSKYEKKDVLNLFKEYGTIESMRIRSVMRKDPKKPRKLSVIRKEFDEKATSFNAYVKFTTEEAAVKALESNGKVVEGHHIRVDLVTNTKSVDNKHSIFIGNLPLDTANDEVWDFFEEECGKVSNVRVVRDAGTNIGKGFGFVTFEDEFHVELAIKKLNGKEFKGRNIRIETAVKKAKKRQPIVQKAAKKKSGSNVKGNKNRTVEKPTAGKKFTRPSNQPKGTFNKNKLVKKQNRKNKIRKFKTKQDKGLGKKSKSSKKKKL